MMKHLKSAVISLILALVFLLVIAPTVSAKIISSEDIVTIAEDEIVDDDLFVSAENVTVKGTVNGDLYVAGGVVTVNGTINGDILAAGGVIDIAGTVKDDVRAAGGNITLNELEVGDNLTVAGGNVSIDDETSVGGSLTFGVGNFVSRARVGRSVLGGGGQVTLDSPIGGDVRVGAGRLTLGSETTVAGDLVYTSEKEALLDEAATVSGAIRQIVPEAEQIAKKLPQVFRRATYGFKIWSYLSALLVGFVLLYLLPSASFEVADEIRFKPGTNLLWGLLILLLAFPIFILLMISVIGIPLGIILFMLLLIEIYLAKIFVGLTLGEIIVESFLKRDLNIYLQLAIGLAVYSILASLPIIRFFVWLLAVVLGLGAIFSVKRVLVTSR